jgi:hypothetical protein
LTVRGARSYHRRVDRSGLVALAAILAALPASGPAFAGEPSDAEQARAAELVGQGTTAAKAGRWEACITALSLALALDPAPATAGALGVCEERAGKLVDAYDHLRRAADAAPSAATGEPWKGYRAALDRITERVGVVWLTVLPREARVLLDERPLSRADGRSFAIEPGQHTITARLDGYEDKVVPVTVRGGDVPHVDLVLTPKSRPDTTPKPIAATPPKAPVAAPAVSPVPAPSPSIPAPFRWCVPAPSTSGVLAPLACAAVATAFAGGATSIGLEVDRTALRRNLSEGACGPDATSRPAACDELAERYEQRNAALGVAIGVTLASGLFAGAARIAFGFERGATSPRIAPTAGANGGGIVVLGSW